MRNQGERGTTNERWVNVTSKHSNNNYVTVYATAGPKTLIMYDGLSQRQVCFNFVVRFKMDPVLATETLAQTKPLRASQADSVVC